ncbi:cell wall protein [Acinetobacter sp. LoGeW2-3]|uniref:BapA/Bap/LapF family prefix-like domain-containing protein n=1 Tax=Acinetobacter sp. LoGeW2-3 TaxID=1808001 RepID=UPI000C059E26|nr:BapA prefix-like domain-containing protein [Acinetobacter sp. LoGeW2-3]ATO20730.1 cell wall protein [Acinetobacter sp. LoGeW2-3]
MKEIQIINKETKAIKQLQADTIRLDQGSIVKIKASKSDIAQLSQEGTNLIVVLRNGEKLIIENFYPLYPEILPSNLVIEDSSGTLYWFDTITKQYKQISKIEELYPSSSFLGENWEWITLGTLLIGGLASVDGGETERDEPLEPVDPPVEVPPVDPPVEVPPVDSPVEEPPVDPPVDPPVEEPPVDPPVEEPPVDPPVEEPPVDPPVEEPPVNPPVEEPPVDPPVEEPPVDPPVEVPEVPTEPTNPIARVALLSLVESVEDEANDPEAASMFKAAQELIAYSSDEQLGVTVNDHNVISSEVNNDVVEAEQLINFISSDLDRDAQVYQVLNTADTISNLNNQMDLLLEGAGQESHLMGIEFMQSDTVSLAELLSDSGNIDNIIVVGSEDNQIIIQTDMEEAAQNTDPFIWENQSDLMAQHLLSDQSQIMG